jgi:purine-binding chemotaxis protein CheW
MNAAARAPESATRWVLFSLDAGRYALPLECVERIVHAAEVTPLPLAPDVVAGALDIAGEILPVYDLRRRFKLPSRPVAVTDQFVVARTRHRRVVLMVDAALGVHDHASVPAVESARLLPGTASGDTTTSGVISLAGGLVLIQDLDRFLSPDEAQTLDAALDEIRHRQEPPRAR